MILATVDDEWPGRAWRGRLDIDQSLLEQKIARGDLNVIRHARHSGGGGWSDPSPVSAGFVITPCLRSTRLAEVQSDGKTVASSVLVPQGGLLIYSLKASYQVLIPDPFDAVSFRLDQPALDRVARRMGMSSAPELSEPFVATLDHTLVHLSRALLPALRRPAEMNGLFAGHIQDAVLTHMVERFGRIQPPQEKVPSGLDGRMQIVRQYMLDHLADDMSAPALAKLCGLSADQFHRAFRKATGLPPHRWLVRERVLRARELLEGTNLPSSEIALICGFADQSHLTRVFSASFGVPPSAWRRIRRK